MAFASIKEMLKLAAAANETQVNQVEEEKSESK